jgi:hypothetical protein
MQKEIKEDRQEERNEISPVCYVIQCCKNNALINITLIGVCVIIFPWTSDKYVVF